jgi:superfamily II DNA or RNA helicase
MMDVVRVEKLNEVYNRIHCEPWLAKEIDSFFTFKVPGYQFMPQYRSGMWNGDVHIFNVRGQVLYGGLNGYLEKFCEEREYQIEYLTDFSADEFSLKEAQDFISSLALPFQPRDYQVDAFVYAVRNRRAVLLSPTASGKSFIIYLISRWFSARTLLIVPTTSLVHQMYTDFQSYGYDSEKHCHRIYSGEEKDVDKPITITTWQSIYKMPKSWFDRFDVVIGDEAHLFKAKSLTSIMEKLVDCQYRFGFTGTLDGAQTHKLVLEGLFGPVKKVTTTKELIDQKHLSAFKIKCIVLRHPDPVCKDILKKKYQDEMDYIVSCEQRNKFIRNLILSLKGNTLLLFQYIEKHGRILYNDMQKEIQESRPVYFVHGGVEGEDRENIRRLVEMDQNAVIIASYGTFSTGINIRNLHNIIFASPSKSRIRNLQSIGRGLRLGENKEECTLFDIADDMSMNSKKNHTLMHFIERMKIYNEEKFENKIYTVKLK